MTFSSFSSPVLVLFVFSLAALASIMTTGVNAFVVLPSLQFRHVTRVYSSVDSTENTEKEIVINQPKKKKQNQPTPPVEINISKLDIRVGLITKAWVHEDADKLYCEEIDIGEESGPRKIASGLKSHYTLDEMIGERVLVLANLKSRKLVGFPSHGMVLCACKYGEKDDGSDDQVEFVVPHPDSKIGDRVLCHGYEDVGEPATENQLLKKKMLNIIFPDLKINQDGIAVYKDKELYTLKRSDNNDQDSDDDASSATKLPIKSISLFEVPIS